MERIRNSILLYLYDLRFISIIPLNTFFSLTITGNDKTNLKITDEINLKFGPESKKREIIKLIKKKTR